MDGTTNDKNQDINLNFPDSSCNLPSSSQYTDTLASVTSPKTVELVDSYKNISDDNTVTSSTHETSELKNHENSEQAKDSAFGKLNRSLKISKKRRRIMTLDDEDDGNSNEEKGVSVNAEDFKESSSIDEIESESDSETSKAKNLLKKAVIIRVPKRSRILDSDDDDVIQTSVDDIGLLDDCQPKSDDELNSEIVVDDPIFSFATQEMQENVSMEISSKQEDREEKAGNLDIDEVAQYFDESAEKIQSDNDDFNRFDESDQEDSAKIPNDEYFGTSDKYDKTGAVSVRKRRNSRHRPSEKKSTKFRNYDKDFVVLSDQESSSDDSSHSSNSDSDPESVSSSSSSATRSNIVKKQKITIVKPQRILGFKRKKKRDRFYDKSRNIPNDIYFGDVKVPLHILHSAWNSDRDSSNSEPEIVSCTLTTVENAKENLRSPPPNSRLAFPSDMTQLSMLKEFVQIVGIKINYSKLFEKVTSTDEKCRLIRRILYSRGLRGEPTAAKCKQMKKEIQARKESSELDKSVIIKTEGRTRRSARHQDFESASELHKNVTFVKPETLQTLSRIKSVVDSDASE